MKSLRTLVGAAAAVVALSAWAPGAGADGAYPGSVKDGPSPYSWSGLYAGIHIGAGWSDTDWNGPATFYAVSRFSTDPDGVLAGGHAGVQHQWGNFVAGIEVSYSGSTLRDRVVGPVPAFPQDAFRTELNDLLLVVGRAGMASQNWLFYAKGGYANGEVELSALSGAPVAGTTFSASERLHGWTAGAGIEWMLHRNIVLGVEYNFVRLGGESFTTTTGGTSPGLPIAVNLDDMDIHTVMARLSVKLDRDRAPAPLK